MHEEQEPRTFFFDVLGDALLDLLLLCRSRKVGAGKVEASALVHGCLALDIAQRFLQDFEIALGRGHVVPAVFQRFGILRALRFVLFEALLKQHEVVAMLLGMASKRLEVLDVFAVDLLEDVRLAVDFQKFFFGNMRVHLHRREELRRAHRRGREQRHDVGRAGQEAVLLMVLVEQVQDHAVDEGDSGIFPEGIF